MAAGTVWLRSKQQLQNRRDNNNNKNIMFYSLRGSWSDLMIHIHAMSLLLWFLNTDGGLISGCHGDLTVVVVVVAMFVRGGCFLYNPVP